MLALAAFTTGCPDGKFPFASTTCQTDNDCPNGKGTKSVCYNTRCVRCHYDGDCDEGQVCNPTRNTCDSIDSRVKEPEAAAPPASLDECIKRCAKEDESCRKSCQELFK